MRPSDLANDPKLAQKVIDVIDAGRRWVELENRVAVLGPHTRGTAGEGPIWEQFNSSYEQQSAALRVLRARILKVGTR